MVALVEAKLEMVVVVFKSLVGEKVSNLQLIVA